MKKLILSLLAVGLLVGSSNAASTTFTLAAAAFTNACNSTLGVVAPVKISQVMVTSAANNTCTLFFLDCPTNILTYTNAAYTNILTYATNYITTYTNYYGVTTSLTNKSLVDVTNNAVAAAAFSYNTEFTVTVPTNSTITFTGLNATFQNGVGVTNSAGGAATITMVYTQ